MSPQKIQYTTTPLSKSVGLSDAALFFAGPSLLVWLSTENLPLGLLIGCIGLIAIAIVKGISRHRSSMRSFSDAKAHLLANGFQADMELRPLFVIDSAGKKIAFMYLQAMSYEIYGMHDILGCEHQWVNKANANGQIAKTQNVLIFKTRNVHQPIYKFQTYNHATGELWLARINALLNS